VGGHTESLILMLLVLLGLVLLGLVLLVLGMEETGWMVQVECEPLTLSPNRGSRAECDIEL
jgi:hypothetical protein